MINESDKLIEIGLYYLPVVNAMESFAMNFTNGLADEEIAFNSVW